MDYLKLSYHLYFEKAPTWGNPPAFVFRSVLGMNLKRIACVLRNQEKCQDCMIKDSCVYSIFFETNISKETKYLSGRDKAPHPFVLDILSLDSKEATVSILYIGKARNYIPYVNAAFERAGKFGIGKDRTKFDLSGIFVNNMTFSSTLSQVEEFSKSWPQVSYYIPDSPVYVCMETPCRIKLQGKYQSSLTIDLLLDNIAKRMVILNEFFSNDDLLPSYPESNRIDSIPYRQRWSESTYYSSHQKAVMRLGGVVGEIQITGELDQATMAYLEAMELFHVGKNISFGLGKVKVVYDENNRAI